MALDQKEQTPEELRLSFEGQSIDWYLQNLVSLVNDSSIQFGITLSVNGLIVSGRLISGKQYFEEFAAEFASAYPGTLESKEEFREALASNAVIYDQESEQLNPPQFIHLADSRVFSNYGEPLPNNRGVLWRGKLNSVSGFSLGQLGWQKHNT